MRLIILIIILSLAACPALAAPPDVPACERVDDARFAKAVFIGDSLTDGLALHGLLPEMRYLSRIGMTPGSARTEALFQHDGKPVTLARKLPYMRADAVYLWLGTNSLVGTDAAKVADAYERLLVSLMAAAPDVPFYLLEATPTRPVNERIGAFNTSLREIATRQGAYLLPVCALLTDADGALAEQYAAQDGVHLSRAAYEILAEYLYTHALPMD